MVYILLFFQASKYFCKLHCKKIVSLLSKCVMSMETSPFFSMNDFRWNSRMLLFLNYDFGCIMADSSQTRIWEGGWSVLACSLVAAECDSWCVGPTELWQAKVWAENDWNTACSFCVLCLSFAASRLSASELWLAFLTDERELSQSKASCCHGWWLFPPCASCLFSWSL